jgi:K+/H+ antiporter YhaU regulatory subunit KhtT
MSIKTLYQFKINREIEEVVKEKSKDKDGNEVTTDKKKIVNKEVQFGIRKPNRKLYEEAELFYGVKLSEGIKAGLLTQPLLAKRYKNDGGSMSETEKKRYAEIYYDLIIKQDELEQIKLNLEKKSEQERAKEASKIMTDIVDLQRELQSFESDQSTLFDQTAENRAKNMVIMWWVLNLSYIKGEEDWIPVFAGNNYEDKLESYDGIEEETDAFNTEMVKKLAYFITFWYMNGISSEDDFKRIEEVYNKDDSEEEEEEIAEEEVAEEEVEAAVEEEAEKVEEEPKKATKKPKLDPDQPKLKPKS